MAFVFQVFELRRLAKGLPSGSVLQYTGQPLLLQCEHYVSEHGSVVGRCKYESGRMEFLLVIGVFRCNQNASINNRLVQ